MKWYWWVLIIVIILLLTFALWAALRRRPAAAPERSGTGYDRGRSDAGIRDMHTAAQATPTGSAGETGSFGDTDTFGTPVAGQGTDVADTDLNTDRAQTSVPPGGSAWSGSNVASGSSASGSPSSDSPGSVSPGAESPSRTHHSVDDPDTTTRLAGSATGAHSAPDPAQSDTADATSTGSDPVPSAAPAPSESPAGDGGAADLPDDGATAEPTNSVLDEGYDPSAATRVMGMTPEPPADQTVAGSESIAGSGSAAASASVADSQSAVSAGTSDAAPSEVRTSADPTPRAATPDAATPAGVRPAGATAEAGRHLDSDSSDAAGTASGAADTSPASAWGGSGPYGSGSAEPNEDGSGPDGFPIKGDPDSMRYHLPGSRFYAQAKAEVWFATEADAAAAGFSAGGGNHD